MIQDIEPKKFHNEYKQLQPQAGDRVFHFKDGKICICQDMEALDFPRYEQVEGHFPADVFIYVFSIDEQRYFLLQQETELVLDGFSYEKMFQVRSYAPTSQVLAAATAWHLDVWYKANRFCGRCGKVLVRDSKERMLRCPCCGNMVFPKIAPAIIVGVTNKDQILMTKYANREYKRYALIAGFTEIGESAEQTVAREVLEETGVHVKNIRYYKSQPWGFDSNLLLGYFAELDGEKSIVMDREELSVAEWVDREDVEEADDKTPLSLTHEMMMFFKDKEKFEQF